MKRNLQQGVALVITLVLLSVITFMAVTFLVVSRSERQAVTTQSDQTDARLAADAARERAIADMIVPIMAFSNANAFQMRVSTNFINRLGFDAPLPANGNRFTNVNYDHKVGGGLLNAGELEQNIANLAYDPRPPVFIRTNGSPPGVSDFRYYLDWNRNGRFDPTGFLPATNNNNQPFIVGGIPVTNNFLGDPEWIGQLERPEFPHSASNKFVSRFAYLVLPTGAALDLNYIYSQNQNIAPNLLPPNGRDGFTRNQGFGSWEINLAAFLRDLNTNFWTYTYNAPLQLDNDGTAFEDARSILRYRYANNLNSLQTVRNLFGVPAATAFVRDYIDGYADNRPLMTTNFAPRFDDDQPTRPWPGADNPQHYFNPQELFDANKVSTRFVNRLRIAGTNNSSYDRYTYYRLLSQLATDSAPEPAGKMNLNYDNLVRANAEGVISATNFIPWQPIDFFTNAANRLLQSATNLGIFNLTITNIPIYPTNYYTPAVHRLLQLAANMYDATTNRNFPVTGFPYVPSVFRPRFGVNGSNIFISGYVEETPQLAQFLTTPVRHLNFPDDRVALASRPDDFVYGVPLVIGAKEGFPNFNEYSLQNIVQVTRKLELRRRNAFSRPNETNQMYVIGISNVFAVEAWNSYSNPFPRNLELYVTNQLSIVLTNENGVIRSNYLTLRQTIPINIPPGNWQGLVNPQVPQQSFRVPILTNVIYLSNSVYYTATTPYFRPLTAPFERGAGFRVPQWGLNISNNTLRYVLVDKTTDRIVDYVNLAGLDSNLDITRELMGNFNVQNEASVIGRQWLTNRPQNSTAVTVPTYGIINQLEVSSGNQEVGLGDWNSYSQQPVSSLDKNKAIDAFRVFMGLSPIYYSGTVNSNLIVNAPFTPSRKIYQNISWQANDPLVHYTVDDLTDLARTNDINFIVPPNQPAPFVPNLSKINARYQPWGGNPSLTPDAKTAYNLALKDPLVTRSDDWDFPTNKFPNLGWLGRVHRGTPWQTIYLKSAPVEAIAWAKWTGNPFDPVRSMPTNDWSLLDLFTVAPNDNASRGQMSVNQTDLPGWSAILSGVIVLTNTATEKELQEKPLEPKFNPLVIEPAGVDGANGQLSRIVAAMNRDRANTNLHPDQTFHRLGDILGTPELTVASPYLNLTNSTQLQRGLSDSVYERIPQQILSLLKVGEPRFVIYSYGQSLKPADRSIVQSGPFTGMSTNYQITGETATRTVIRIEGAPNQPRAVIESFNVLPPD